MLSMVGSREKEIFQLLRIVADRSVPSLSCSSVHLVARFDIDRAGFFVDDYHVQGKFSQAMWSKRQQHSETLPRRSTA